MPASSDIMPRICNYEHKCCLGNIYSCLSPPHKPKPQVNNYLKIKNNKNNKNNNYIFNLIF